MTPMLASMTERVISRLAANDGGGLSETLKGSFARVAEVTMPSSWRRSRHQSTGTEGRRRELQGVEGPRAVTSKEDVPGT